MKGLLVISLSLWICVLAQDGGDVRLRGTSSSGRLEIYLNGAWGTVCAEGFDVYDADIACQQLGFLYADRVGTVGELGYNEGTGPIWLDGVECSFFITTLVDCARAPTVECDHSQDVAIRCSREPNPLQLVSQTGRNTSLSAGRLEIFIDGRWGTVCDDGFDIHDANVACRQMGLTEAVGYGTAANLGYSGSLSSPIWLDDVDCSSSTFLNDNLRQCRHVGTGRRNCGHSQDVILSCLAGGNLRLVSGGPSTILASSGRLEIYLRRSNALSTFEWGTLCDDGSFTSEEADVACRQLGFVGADEFGTDLGFPAAPSSSEVWLDNFDCTSDDLTLFDCVENPIISSCPHSQDIQLRCSNGRASDAGAVVGAIVGSVVVIIFVCSLCICCCVFGYVCGFSCNRPRNTVAPPHSTVVTGNTTCTAYPAQPQPAPPRYTTNQNPAEHNNGAGTLKEAPPPSYEVATAYPSPTYPYPCPLPDQSSSRDPPQAQPHQDSASAFPTSSTMYPPGLGPQPPPGPQPTGPPSTTLPPLRQDTTSTTPQ